MESTPKRKRYSFIKKSESFNLSDICGDDRFSVLISLLSYAATRDCGSMYIIEGHSIDYCKATKINGDDKYSPKLTLSSDNKVINIEAYDANGASFCVLILN